MHVIECAHYGGPYRGSFVPMLAATAREASRRGHRCSILLSEVARGRPWIDELAQAAPIHFAPAGPSRVASLGPLRRSLSRLAADAGEPAVIHTHFSAFDIAAALVALARPHISMLQHEHGPVSDAPRARMRNSLRYLALGRAIDGILCVSPELQEALRCRHAPADRLELFPNAVDVERFGPIQPAERQAARQALGLGPGERAVLHFAWHWEIKGGPLMIATARQLADEPGVRLFTVLGETGRGRAEVAQVRGVTALSPTDDVRRLFAGADAMLCCSQQEGMPLAVLEALACGLPVVAVRMPVLEGLLSELPGAVSVAAHPQALANAIRDVLRLGEGELRSHRALARERVVERFELGSWACRVIDRCEAAVSRGLGPTG